MKQSRSEVVLKLPIIDRSNYTHCYAGVRGFRKKGIRIEKETKAGKVIFHNYGHGGAGVSLAPATAIQVVQLVNASIAPQSHVAVLGSGIVGLVTALQLVKKGYYVTIYAKVIPDEKERDNSKLCTSQIAPGYWFPYHYQFPNFDEHNRRSEIAFKQYREWQHKYKGIYRCDVYEDINFEQFKQLAPPFMWSQAQEVSVRFSPESTKFKSMVRFSTFKINLRILLQQLIQQCQRKNVNFIQKSFHTEQDILNLSEKHLVNCLGLSSKYLFNDSLMYGTRGHILEFHNPLKISDFLCFVHRNKSLKFYCFDDKVLVGLTSERTEQNGINKEKVQQIYENALNFIAEYSKVKPRPKL